MNFHYQDNDLHCEAVPLSAIAQEVGTPFYVYSLNDIELRARAYLDAFPQALIAYAYKANANLAILRHLVSLGIGADVVSGGELWRALQAGTPPAQIVFNGNGKSAAEIAYALDSDVLCINIDSVEEMELLAEVARAKGKTAPIAFRVNPDIDPKTHPYISTGLKKSKFGVPIADAAALYLEARRHPELSLTGVHCHIGSQITQPEPMLAAAQSIGALLTDLRAAGINLPLVNLGGGLGIVYHDENPLTPAEWAKAVRGALGAAAQSRLVLEPGRSIVGASGALVAAVIHLKRAGTKNFLVIDAGMNDLLRPALYSAYHEIQAVRPSAPLLTMDVVGPICESADVLGRDRELPALQRGELVAIRDAGAYGFSMASRYNQQPLPAEVIVHSGQWRVVTQRESWQQMAEREA